MEIESPLTFRVSHERYQRGADIPRIWRVKIPEVQARKTQMGLLRLAGCTGESVPSRLWPEIAEIARATLTLTLTALVGSVPAYSEPSPSSSECLAGAVLADASETAPPTNGGSRNSRLANVLGLGYGVQYWGTGYTAEDLAAAPHGLLIIEATKLGATDSWSGREELFSSEEVRQIRRDGARPTLGYINLSEIETYRDYWVATVTSRTTKAATGDVDGLPSWVGPQVGTNEWLAIYWAPEWEAILMARLERLLALGLDGVFLDDALHYYNYASGEGLEGRSAAHRDDTPEGAPGFARAMMGLVERLAARARALRCDSIVIVNNGVFIGRDAGPESSETAGAAAFERYRSAIDGILMESMLSPVPQDAVIEVLHEDFASHGVPVLTLDFLSHALSSVPSDEVRNMVVARAAEAGFLPYVADDEAFDRLYPPIRAPIEQLPRPVKSRQ